MPNKSIEFYKNLGIIKNVKDIIFPNDNIGICYFSDKTELHIDSDQTNIVTAAFVTAQARLKLYRELRKFGKNVVY